MVVHIESAHVAGLVPSWFARHVVANESTIDAESLEAHVLHTALLVVTADDGVARSLAIVTHVAEQNVLNTSSRGSAVL